MNGEKSQTAAARFIDPDATENERLWATLIHLSGFAFSFAPILHVVAPLVLWLMKREASPFLDDHGKEAVNFQISILIWMMLGGLLVFCGIGIIMLIALPILNVVMMIVNGIRANRGEYVRYPITIRFIV